MTIVETFNWFVGEWIKFFLYGAAFVTVARMVENALGITVI